jgi:DNA-binding response OmpR family regulator
MNGLQILAIDDNEMQLKLVVFLLEEAGYDVRTAASAQEALEVLRSYTPSLILMDVQLPGMDGLELTRMLRRDAAYAMTTIVALSAYADASDLEKAREAGCDGNIAKPIDTATFTRQVGCYFNRNIETEPDIPRDSHDLLAEMRNMFLAEGLEQCTTMLRSLKLKEGGSEGIERVIHRWAGMGGTLGFPGISEEARTIEALLDRPNRIDERLPEAIETARRRFMAATRTTAKLPLAVIAGLRNVRIGLVDFPEEEANRIQNAARRANVQVEFQRMTSEYIEEQTECGALIVNQCALPAREAMRRPQPTVPAVYIGSRSSLQSLTKLPPRAFDFMIAPWDAEEVLIRVYRLIAKPAPQKSEREDDQEIRDRVLVVDDDPSLVAIVADMLQQFGLDCDIARSGRQALAAVQRRAPDAIILDVNMLDLNGFEVLKRLRRNEVTKDIPVLLLTARRNKDDIMEGFGCGADDYVIKPFKPLDLVKRVDKLISIRKAARAEESGQTLAPVG